MKKTNAVRGLDRAGIPYRLIEYDFDEDDLGAGAVSKKTGFPLERIFKTLVVRGEKTDIFFAVIPGDAELDLKSAAALTGNKSCDLVHLKEVQPLTGYQRGGVSPLGAKRPFPVLFDESALFYDEICVSAGLRGLQVVIDPRRLIEAAHGTVGPLSRR